MSGSLDGKTILITGASSGIGEATARKAVALGANVVLGARRADRLEALAAELGAKAAWRATDVTRKEDLEALAALALERFGRIDVLINNAGIMPASTLITDMVDDWDRMIDVNLKGVLYGVRAVLQTMIDQDSGHIITISSVAGLHVLPASSVYSATKWGARVINEGLRKELSGKNIRITTIYPGPVATELADSVTIPAIRERAAANLSAGMSPDVIADAILYALTQPDGVAISEMVIRPTHKQDF
jgi:NADP-dependent 3-hydroxy acid dehydrogenase YdfG